MMRQNIRYRYIAVPITTPAHKLTGRPRKEREPDPLVLINFKVNEKERKVLIRRAKQVTGGNLSEYMRIVGTMPKWVFAYWFRKARI